MNQSIKSLILKKAQRIVIAGFPTPLQRMPNLSKKLDGPNLFVKRDDVTDLAFGGNKARKLEFLLAEAKDKGADTLIATGSVQSNCACMVAAAARRLGMNVVLVLLGKEPKRFDGNLLLEKILSADIRFVQAWGPAIPNILRIVADEEKEKGHNPYIIPVGASTPLSILGYAIATEELHDQFTDIGERINHIVCASGTGGTQAGLVMGTKMLEIEAEVLGISVAPEKEALTRRISSLINSSAQLFKIDLSVTSDEITVFDEYVNKGYGVLNNAVIEAIKLVSETEGIFLDPVYTGKAMAALIDLIKKGYFRKEDNVVFLHTGGLPALFLYKEELSESLP